MNFPSKVDWWFPTVFFASAALGFALAYFLRRRSLGGALTAGLVGLLMLVVAGTSFSLSYEVSDSEVYARHPLNGRNRLFTIDAVKSAAPSTESWSAPAASLDRLKVWHATSRPDGWVLISPADKAGFLKALCDRSPALLCDNEHLTRRASN